MLLLAVTLQYLAVLIIVIAVIVAGSYFLSLLLILVICFDLFGFTMMESSSGSKVKLSGRYCCVTGCSSSDYKLDNWGKLHCNKHNCLNRSDKCSCRPPYQFNSFPTEAKKPALRKGWLQLINRVEKSSSN